MLTERLPINTLLKMTYYPGLGRLFSGGFVFHSVYFDCNLTSGSIFFKLVLKIMLNY